MAINNRTLHTHVFFKNSVPIELYPGLNILSETDEEYLSNDDRVQDFVDGGLFAFTGGISKKIYTDDETGMSYVDDVGTKLPVSEQGKHIEPQTGDDIPPETVKHFTLNKKFKTAELRKLGVSAENATKIISNTPSEGYNAIEELPDIGSDIDKIASVFTIDVKEY